MLSSVWKRRWRVEKCIAIPRFSGTRGGEKGEKVARETEKEQPLRSEGNQGHKGAWEARGEIT